MIRFVAGLLIGIMISAAAADYSTIDGFGQIWRIAAEAIPNENVLLTMVGITPSKKPSPIQVDEDGYVICGRK